MKLANYTLLLHALTGDIDAAFLKLDDGTFLILGGDGQVLGQIAQMGDFIPWAKEYQKNV